jgi:hypothetical protein
MLDQKLKATYYSKSIIIKKILLKKLKIRSKKNKIDIIF